MNWRWPKQLELSKPLAQGWLGELYVSQDLELPRQVVTRLIRPEHRALVEDGHLKTALELGATREHPQLLPTTLPEQHEQHLFYNMQLAEAGSLRSLLGRYRQRGQLPDPLTLLDIARQTAEGLKFIQQHQRVHGNLKPENVLLQPGRALLGREGFQVLLSDAGLNAWRLPDPQSPYLSPPQRAGRSAVPQDDAYALGALLFEGLSGEPLPLVPSLEDLQAVPAEYRALVRQCLGLSSSFADVGALLDALRAHLPAPVHTEPPPALSLHTEQPQLELRPGETAQLRIQVQAQHSQALRLVWQGWPPGWSEPLPSLHLQAGARAEVLLSLTVPRHFRSEARTHQVALLALGSAEPPQPSPELARLPLEFRVWPFSAGRLSLIPLEGPGYTRAKVRLELINEGNEPRDYELQLSAAAGKGLEGLPEALRLVPGEQYQQSFDWRWPLNLFWPRTRTLSARAEAKASEQQPAHHWQAAVTLHQAARLPWWLSLASVFLLGALAWNLWPRSSPVPSELVTVSPSIPSAKGPAAPATATQTTIKPAPAPVPKVVRFSVAPQAARYGETVQVQWAVEAAQTVQLSPLGVLPPSGTRSFKLYKSQLLTLQLPGGQHSQLKLKLLPPEIQAFRVTPEQLQPGQEALFSWQVRGASQVRLEPFGTVPAQGSRRLSPPQGSIFTLKASNGEQEVLSRVSLSVQAPAVRLLSLKVSPAQPLLGQPFTLTWQSQGAVRTELRWGDQRQTLPPSGQLSLTATPQTRTLNLLAIGEQDQTDLRSLTLPLREKPRVQLNQPPAPTKPAPKSHAPVAVRVTPAEAIIPPQPSGSAATKPEPAATTPRPWRGRTPVLAESTGPYRPFAGQWKHSFGTLTVQIKGHQLKGIFHSDRADRSSGVLRGSLHGSVQSPTFNGVIKTPAGSTVVVLSFTQNRPIFTGIYADRTKRERWCGWRSPYKSDPCLAGATSAPEAPRPPSRGEPLQ